MIKDALALRQRKERLLQQRQRFYKAEKKVRLSPST
jgi:hypothetical protein